MRYPTKNKGRFYINFKSFKKDEVGTHFVLIALKNNTVYYFDPLGLPCINSHISNFMKNLAKKIVSNLLQFQCLNSFFCGYYCILFVLLHDLGISFKKFQSLFSKDCKQNDIIVIELIKYVISNYGKNE